MATREFAVPNVGPGPDPFAFADLDADFAVLLLHRDYYCSNCRQQVTKIKRRYEAFRDRDAEVVSVLPEPVDRAREWQAQYDLPFPLLADEEGTFADRFDQPRKYGLLGRLHDIIGRMPAALVLDLRGEGPDPEPVYAHRGSAPGDRPAVDTLLSELDRAAATAPPGAAGGPAGASQRAEAVERGGRPGEPDRDATAEGADDTAGGPESVLGDGSVSPPAAPEGVVVRVADGDDVLPVMRVIQGALLDVDADTIRETVARGDALVADADGYVVGALLLRDLTAEERTRNVPDEDAVIVEGRAKHVEAIAVRRERRGQGIGSALVQAALTAHERLTADFRHGVRGFWQDLGFDIEAADDRLWGERK